MTICCKACGQENDLGRVFCVGCGARLELKGIDVTTMDAEVRSASRAHWIRRLALTLLIAIAAAVALALVPPPPLAIHSDPSGGRQVEALISQARLSVMGGHAVDVEAPEAALNAAIAARAGTLHLAPMQVRLSPAAFTVRATTRWAPLAAWTNDARYAVSVTLSLDVRVDGGRLVPDTAYIGRLPLPGKMGGSIVRWFALRGAALWRPYNLDPIYRGVAVEPGRATLHFGFRP